MDEFWAGVDEKTNGHSGLVVLVMLGLLIATLIVASLLSHWEWTRIDHQVNDYQEP